MRRLTEHMRYGAGFAYDVLHPDVACNEGVADEVSVAPPRQRFCAHQRQTVLPCQRHDFEQVVGEFFGLHVVGVAAETAVFPCEVYAVGFGVA